MPVGDEIGAATGMNDAGNLQTNDTEQRLPGSEVMDDDGNVSEHREIRMPQTRKKVKTMLADSQIALRNTDLAQWNNEYLQNMAVASKQKQNNKIPTLSKRNAAFWILGQGIGSVGVGLGTSREPHPLNQFSGDELYASLSSDGKPRGRKRGRPDDSDSESESRRVRPRDEDQIGLGWLPDEAVMQDVRIHILILVLNVR
jgi:meiotic recombination protein REC8